MEKDPSSDLEHLRDAIHRVSECLTTVSTSSAMAYRCRPSILEDLGLVKAVHHLVDDFSARTGITELPMCVKIPGASCRWK